MVLDSKRFETVRFTVGLTQCVQFLARDASFLKRIEVLRDLIPSVEGDDKDVLIDLLARLT